MKIIKGDLLNETTGLIAHGVNCQGVMGKGIALAIKKKYPQVFIDYKQYFDIHPFLKEGVSSRETPMPERSYV